MQVRDVINPFGRNLLVEEDEVVEFEPRNEIPLRRYPTDREEEGA
jgi:hypothetical protein